MSVVPRSAAAHEETVVQRSRTGYLHHGRTGQDAASHHHSAVQISACADAPASLCHHGNGPSLLCPQAFIAIQAYNRSLKIIAERLGIHRALSNESEGTPMRNAGSVTASCSLEDARPSKGSDDRILLQDSTCARSSRGQEAFISSSTGFEELQNQISASMLNTFLSPTSFRSR